MSDILTDEDLKVLWEEYAVKACAEDTCPIIYDERVVFALNELLRYRKAAKSFEHCLTAQIYHGMDWGIRLDYTDSESSVSGDTLLEVLEKAFKDE